MSFSETSLSDFASCIELFSMDIKRYTNIYEKLDNDLDTLISNMKKDKLKFKLSFSDLDESLGLNIFTIDEIDVYLNHRSKLEKELSIDLTKFDIINESENILVELGSLLQEISNNHQDILKTENPNKGVVKYSNAKVNPHILQSRQTRKPFILIFMTEVTNYRCNGCKQTIPLQVPYLSHLEEYPAGSKMLRSHSYHINNECFSERGFEDKYLSRTRVDCQVNINDNIRESLLEIGFQSKNIRMNVDPGSDSDSLDTMSQHSGASKEASTFVTFVMRRKNATQKKKMACVSCQQDITADSFLTLGYNFEAPFHMNKICIRDYPAVSNDFSEIKCQVYKLLKNHNELKQVLGCGFYFKNIIGNKPPNPAIKPKPPVATKSASEFIFNNEPFTCERLLHAERCRGCSDQVRKETMALRHREQVPRDKLTETPMVSQFYHVERNCLIDRGFTIKYLELAKCHVVLVGSDNLQSVRDILIRCGFSGDRLTFRTSDEAIRQGALSPTGGNRKSTNSSYLFIETCSKYGAKCEGCNLSVTVNEASFLYGETNVQDRNARYFHISKECLRGKFTSSEILGMSCVNSNSLVDMNPMDIMRCGLVNITTTLPHNPRLNNPLQRTHPRFVVDTSMDIVGNCSSCKAPLARDKYVLRAISERHYLPVNMHLDVTCVVRSGYVASQLAQCDLTYAVHVTGEARQRLMECGFRKLPTQ